MASHSPASRKAPPDSGENVMERSPRIAILSSHNAQSEQQRDDSGNFLLTFVDSQKKSDVIVRDTSQTTGLPSSESPHSTIHGTCDRDATLQATPSLNINAHKTKEDCVNTTFSFQQGTLQGASSVTSHATTTTPISVTLNRADSTTAVHNAEGTPHAVREQSRLPSSSMGHRDPHSYSVVVKRLEHGPASLPQGSLSNSESANDVPEGAYSTMIGGIPIPTTCGTTPIIGDSKNEENQGSSPTSMEHTAVDETCSMDVGEQVSSSMSKRTSLPLDVRNKKMQATDCLLFAATLLAEDRGTKSTHSQFQSKSEESLIKDRPENDRKRASCGTSIIEDSSVAISIASQPGKSSVTMRMSELSKNHVSKTLKPLDPLVGATIGTTPPTNSVAVVGLKEEMSKEPTPNAQKQISSSIVEKPNIVDVLCGRGGKVNKHPGNVIYRRVVAFNKPYYQSVHKRNRILVSQSIVQAIINHGGRFLITVQNGKQAWTPIDFRRAVQKTSQALREFKKNDDDYRKD